MNIINIAVCDDEKITHVIVKTMIIEYMTNEGVIIKMKHFFSPEQLLHSKEEYDILFLDYEFPDKNGITVAHDLRRYGNDCKIIMLTRHSECFKDAFKIKAIRFITKDINREDFFEALDYAIHTIVGNNNIELQFAGKKVLRPQRAIDYIEANDDFLKVYIGCDVYYCNLTLSKLEEEVLDSRIFCRCHKSIIVNFESIDDIENNIIFLKNKKKIKIAQRRKKDFMQAFIKYDTRIR